MLSDDEYNGELTFQIVHPQAGQSPLICFIYPGAEFKNMLVDQTFQIMFDSEVLAEHYMPPDIPAREPQIKKLKTCLSPSLQQEFQG
jgi:hypothetical protein